MNLPLLEVHRRLLHCFNPATKTFDAQTLSDLVYTRYETLELFLFECLAEAKNEKEVSVTVRTMHLQCSCLIRRLKHSLSTGVSDPQGRVILIELAKFHFFLYCTFSQYFNPDERMPVYLFLQVRKKISTQLQLLKKRKAATEAEERWLAIVLLQSDHLIGLNNSANCSCHLFRYLQTLLKELTNSANVGETLFRLNFNHPLFIRSYMQYLEEEVAKQDGLQEQYQFWSFKLAEIQLQINNEPLRFLTNQIGPASGISTLIQQKLKLLRLHLENNKAFMNGQIVETKGEKILTHLSVTQLAVFVRLLTEVNILQTNNQSELLKKIASTIRTSKTDVVSAESLRVKFYSPERPAILIVREYLFQMINKLKELE